VIKDYRFKIDPLQWHEGMPLAPQHFQLNDHRYQSLLSFHTLNNGPYHWGVFDMQLDSLALGKGLFKLQKITAIMPDGTVVQYEERDQLPKLEIPLGEVDFKSQSKCAIYLALPSYSPGEPSATGNVPRYISTAGDVVMDENGSFGEPTRVPRLAPNLYLIVGQTPSSKFINFQIAEIAKTDNQYILTTFVPPLLSLSKDSLLKKALNDLALTIRTKILYSLERYDAASDSSSHTHTRDILHTLIEALMPFETIVAAEGVHPFSLYRSLVEVASKISRLKLELNHPPLFNIYDHTNIYGAFKPIIDYINNIIDRMYDKVQTRKFQQKRGFFGLGLPTVWKSKTLILGIRKTTTTSQSDSYNWIENALIGTEKFAQSILDRRIVGAARRIISSDEKSIVSAPNDVVLVEVDIDPQFISFGEVLYVFNPSDGQHNRPTEVYHYVTINDI
jgi:type VI secretion system protein ImpJ